LLALFLFQAHAATSPADLAKEDLAKRLKAPTSGITVVTDRSITWQNGALGLPKPDEMVTMALVPGRLIVLESKNEQYLYTASAKAIRYGGPVELWKQSIASIVPIPDEPNLNGNLVQTSCVGTNPQVLLGGVSSFEPQSDGSILATRRTSRSGFDLLYLPKGVVNKPQKLGSAFAYSAMAFEPTTKRWASSERPSLATDWRIIVGKVGDSSKKAQVLPVLSAGNPSSLYWFDGNLLAEVKDKFFSINPQSSDPQWTPAMHPIDLEGPNGILLNKSESLEISSSTVDGKVATKVSLIWFTGDEKVVATIPGFKMSYFKLASNGWVFLSGKEGDLNSAYLVQMRSGLVVNAATKLGAEVKLINATPSNVSELHLNWLPDKYHFTK
jgi:hypothetical protein